MKFRWVPNSYGRSGIIATAESQDSQPAISELWLDYNIENFDQDRFAVASALAFGEFASRRMVFGAAVSHRVSTAIEAFVGRTAVRVDPIHYDERPTLSGDSLIYVYDEISPNSSANRLGGRREIRLEILPSEKYAGGLLQMDRLSIASNAWLFSNPADHAPFDVKRMGSFVAAAVLLAGDLSGAGVRVPNLESISMEQRLTLGALLGSVGLSLH